MIVRTRGRYVVSGLAALALSLSVTSCGTRTGETDVTRGHPSSSTDVSESVSPPPSPTPTPSPSAKPSRAPSAAPGSPEPSVSPAAPDPTRAAKAPARVTTRDRLLTATAMPGFNRQFTWRATGTRPREGRDPFGTCHKYVMTSIGATSVVVRSYRPAERGSDATAGHLVAEFADTMTARRAFEVLKSWRGQCAEELAEFARTDVGRLQAVAVPAGAVGGWYLLRYGPAGGNAEEAYFDAHGFARAGTRVAVVQMRLVGQDYTYPAGKEPMVTAVKAAAGLLAP